MPARSPRACATWLLRRPCRRWPGTRRSVSRAGRRGQRDPVRRGGAGQRLASSSVRPAHRAIRPRSRPGAARARLVRLRRARRSSPPSWPGPTSRSFGIEFPPTSARRRRAGGDGSCAGLWADSTDFSLDGDRLGEAIAELEAGGEAATTRSRSSSRYAACSSWCRLELATATIVRAETVEVPAEARASEGGGGAGWEPTFLAAARVSAREAKRGRRSEGRTRARVPWRPFAS